MKKRIFAQGQMVSISTKELYENKEKLKYAKITTDDVENNANCYDLYNTDNQLACMDGEVCMIKEIRKDLIVFLNENGDTPVEFILTLSEARIAIFKKIEQSMIERKAVKFARMIDDLKKDKTVKEIKNIIHTWWLNYQISDITEQKLLEYVRV